MNLDAGQWAVIGVCAVLLVGYIRGFYYNRQRAKDVSAWLAEGLNGWGKISIGQKVPGMASGGRLIVAQAATPFRRIEVLFLLAPRENLLFWLFHRLLGKGDELVIWITFRSQPDKELEVARRGDRQLQRRLKDTDKKPLILSEGPRGLLVAVEEKEGAALAGKVQSFLEQYDMVVIRLAIRRSKPHLFLRANLRVMQSCPAAEFLSALGELAK